MYFGVKRNCLPGEVVVLINEAESLIGVNVLSMYNAVLQSTNALVLYTEYLKINLSNFTLHLGDFKSPIKFYEKAHSFKSF